MLKNSSCPSLLCGHCNKFVTFEKVGNKYFFRKLSTSAILMQFLEKIHTQNLLAKKKLQTSC